MARTESVRSAELDSARLVAGAMVQRGEDVPAFWVDVLLRSLAEQEQVIAAYRALADVVAPAPKRPSSPTSGPTRHNHGPSYGRIMPDCPRCAELSAGAPARTGRGWV